MRLTSEAVVSRVTNIVMGVCLTGLAIAVALSVSPSLRQRAGISPTPPPPAYEVGETIDVDASLYSTTPHTLLIFGRSTCAACQKSQPMYADFVRMAGTVGIPTRLVTTERDLGPEIEFAGAMGIPADHVVQMTPKVLRVTRVPLLILIDSTGVIQHLWPSIPDESQTADVIKTLRGLQGTPE